MNYTPNVGKCKAEMGTNHLGFIMIQDSESMLFAIFCCHLSTFVQPDGIWLASLGVSGNADGHVNVFVPVASVPTPFTQFVVAFVGFQVVKLTSIDASFLQS